MSASQPIEARIGLGGDVKDIRCHSIASGWFHATMPTVGEVIAAADAGPYGMVAVVDRHLILSQCSFADYELRSAVDIPMPVFIEVGAEILSTGIPAKADGTCHG